MRVGQHIGKYVLGEQIARGGMAEVWAARVEGPGGFVKSLALKFILESFAGDAELERLFFNEARVAARMSHANLVAVFDFDRIADPEQGGLVRHYIAMERVDGHDLRRVLQMSRHKGQSVPCAVALHVTGEVLKGLRYVHELRDPAATSPLGLVHRDVSPHNVLVGMAGEVKLSDFGIAKARTQSLGTLTGMVRGKLAYASPEQLRGQPADHRSDQFALGIVLWEMLAARRLFGNVAEAEIIDRVLRCEVPPLPPEARVEASVESVVRRMLAAAPEDRYPSTAAALSAVLAAPGYTASADPLTQLMTTLFEARPAGLPPTVPMKVSAPPPVVGAAAVVTSESELQRGARDGAGSAAAKVPEPPGVAGDVSPDSALIEAWWIASDSDHSGARGAAGETREGSSPKKGSRPDGASPSDVATAASHRRAGGRAGAGGAAPRYPTGRAGNATSRKAGEAAVPAAAPVKGEATTLRLEPDDVTGSAYVSAAVADPSAILRPWADTGGGGLGRRLIRRVSVVGLLLGSAVLAVIFVRRNHQDQTAETGASSAATATAPGAAGTAAAEDPLPNASPPSAEIAAPPLPTAAQGPEAIDEGTRAGASTLEQQAPRGRAVTIPGDEHNPDEPSQGDETGSDSPPTAPAASTSVVPAPRPKRPVAAAPGGLPTATPRLERPPSALAESRDHATSTEPPISERRPRVPDPHGEPSGPAPSPLDRLPVVADPRRAAPPPGPPSSEPPSVLSPPKRDITAHPSVTHPLPRSKGVPANGAPILE